MKFVGNFISDSLNSKLSECVMAQSLCNQLFTGA